jgi:hypothetical protein
VRIGADQFVDDLTAAAFDFDVFPGAQGMLLDFLEQASAARATNFYPPNAGPVFRRDLARREHCVLQVPKSPLRLSDQESA